MAILIEPPQPPQNELSALQNLSDNAGFLKKTGDGNYSIDSNSYLTANQTITVSGDATGSGTTNISLTLAASGVTAGTYNNSATQVRPFAVDAKGRITSVGAAVTITPAWASINSKPTTLSGFGITDAQPLGDELTAIQALADTAGFLKKTSNGVYEIDNNNYLPLSGGTVSGVTSFSDKIAVGPSFSISSISGGFSNISLGNNLNSEYGRSSIEIPTNTLYGGVHQSHTGVRLACGEMVGWTTAKFKIYVSNDWGKYNPIPCFSVTDAGGTFLGSVKATSFSVGNNQVVSSRRTGWGVPTGTATRTTFATSTITLSQLAERVKALIDDLIAHGLIGA